MVDQNSQPNGNLSASELEALVSGSFLRNVPALMQEGMSFETAVKEAYERDFELLLGLQMVAERLSSGGRVYGDKDQAYAEIINQLSLNVWKRSRAEQTK